MRRYMVFDVGGTEIKYSVMTEELERSASGSVPTPMDSQESFLNTLAALYEPHRSEVEGIAMSLPGFIDAESGMVRGGGALLYNIGTPVGPRLAEKCGCPVWLENDGKAAAMAEFWKGSLQGCRNASVFIIGTGVGGGLIVDGKLVRGLHCTAGEFSFVNTSAENWQSPASLMAMGCSTSALLACYRAAAHLAEDAPLDGRVFFSALKAGDAAAQQAFDWFCRQVAIQIYNLTVLLDVERVAIGGGISKQPVLIEGLQKAYRALMDTHPFGKDFAAALPAPEILPCRFGSEANQVGALYSCLLAQGLV